MYGGVKRTRKVLEKTIEKYLTTQCKKAGMWAVKIPADYLIGIPDRMVLQKPGIVHFIEVKRPGGKPRKAQIRIHKLFAEFGFPVKVIDTKEGVDEFIQEATILC